MAFSAPACRRRAVVPFRALRAARSPPRRAPQRSLGDFERLPGLRLARPAAQRSTEPEDCMTSPKYVSAATPSPLVTARADRALAFRPRIRDTVCTCENRGLGRRARPAQESRRRVLEGFAPPARRAHPPSAEPAPALWSRTGTGGGAALRFARCRYAHCDALCRGTRGAGARCAAGRAQRGLRGPCPKPAAGWRDLGASPQRARPPGRLQAQARGCCPRAANDAGRCRPIAHERRRCLAGSWSVRDGRRGRRPRREGCCIGREAHLRLSTHQVPLSRLSHAY